MVARLATARCLGAGLGILFDAALGEPPPGAHPVAAFGRAMQGLEAHLYGDRRSRGLAHASIGAALGAAAGAALGLGARRWRRGSGAVAATAVATWTAVAGRELGRAARVVEAGLGRGDLEAARAALPALVGRDPAGLDEAEIARAVVESVAENTVDAVVGPALWAAVGGAPGALAYRAVNTMDAMVGHLDHRYRNYGWAAARLDDAANLVPARLTAALVATVRPGAARDVWSTVRRDAARHPSPNAGVAEAAFAAALGLRLGGTNRYGPRTEHRARLGSGRPATAADISTAVRLSRDVGFALAGALIVAGGMAA